MSKSIDDLIRLNDAMIEKSRSQFEGIKIIPSENLPPMGYCVMVGMELWKELQTHALRDGE